MMKCMHLSWNRTHWNTSKCIHILCVYIYVCQQNMNNTVSQTHLQSVQPNRKNFVFFILASVVFKPHILWRCNLLSKDTSEKTGTSLQCMDICIFRIMYLQIVNIEFVVSYVYIATPINRIPTFISAKICTTFLKILEILILRFC